MSDRPPGPLAAYLAEFDRHLVAGLQRRKAVLAEVEDHLRQSADGLESAGLARAAAEQEAAHRFGAPDEAAARLGADVPARIERRVAFCWRRYDRWHARHPWLGTSVPFLPFVGILITTVGAPGAKGWTVSLAAGIVAAYVVFGLQARRVTDLPGPGFSTRLQTWRREQPASANLLWAAMFLSIGVASTVLTKKVSLLIPVGFSLLLTAAIGPRPTRPAGGPPPSLRERAMQWAPGILLLTTSAAVLGRRAWLAFLVPVAAFALCSPRIVKGRYGQWAQDHPMVDAGLRVLPLFAMLMAFFLSDRGPDDRVPPGVLVAMAIIPAAFMAVSFGLRRRSEQRSALAASLAAGSPPSNA